VYFCHLGRSLKIAGWQAKEWNRRHFKLHCYDRAMQLQARVSWLPDGSRRGAFAALYTQQYEALTSTRLLVQLHEFSLASHATHGAIRSARPI